jgi:hypothetical protein
VRLPLKEMIQAVPFKVNIQTKGEKMNLISAKSGLNILS